MALRTGGPSLMREVNRSLALELIRERPRSRADIAADTGLNKATVSVLVDGLIGDGIVREAGAAQGAVGRPPVLLEVDPAAGYVIGAEQAIDHLNVLITDFQGRRVAGAAAPIRGEDGPDAAIDRLIALIEEVLGSAGVSIEAVLGIGLSVCGLVDHDDGSVVFSPNHGWRDVPFRARLSAHFPVAIFVENDATISAIGEHMFGVARGVDDFVMVSGTGGLGIGIAIGGQLVRGANGWAGEVGHTTIEPTGPRCQCGNSGCWEVYASDRALLERIEDAVRARRSTSLDRGDGGSTSISDVAVAADEGDAVALEAIAETGRYLGLGVANIINTLNPSMVVIGGALSLTADRLLPEVEAQVAQHALSWPRSSCRIVVASHRDDSCAMGGVALVVTERFTPGHLRIPRPAGQLSRV